MKIILLFACAAIFAAPTFAFDEVRAIKSVADNAQDSAFSVAMSRWPVWSVISARSLRADVFLHSYTFDLPEDDVSTRVHWALRPRVGLLWEWQNRGDVLDLDEVTLGLGFRMRF